MKIESRTSGDDRELSIKILRQAVPKMTALDIAVTPVNYAVWYEYCLGTNPLLKLEIDKLLSSGTSFTSSTNDRLFKEFLAEPGDAEKLCSVQSETQSLISGLINKIRQISQGTADFSDVLSSYSDQLQDNPTEATLAELIEGLGSELTQVMQKNKGMAASLSQMDKEVNELRHEMESLQNEVMTDPLTTLFNRRAFDHQMQQVFNGATEGDKSFSMMVVDIDFFKKVNDTYGHQTGDKVIAYVGRLLKKGVRSSDFVARYGGEEFVIILPDTDFNIAMTVAEGVRAIINEKKLSIGAENRQSLGRISVSVGVSSFCTDDSIDDCMARADEALYQAKSSGRNCVKGIEKQHTEVKPKDNRRAEPA